MLYKYVIFTVLSFTYIAIHLIKYLYVEEDHCLTGIFSNSRKRVGNKNDKYP